MSRDIPVKGTAELLAVLDAFPRNLQNRAYRSGLTAAARPVRDLARQLAPKESGEMARGIRTGSPRRNEDGNYEVRVSVTGPHGFLGVMQEWGVAPHFITAGDSEFSPRLLTRAGKTGFDVVAREAGDGEPEVLKIGDNYITGAIQHPGHAAHPFMRPALDGAADEAVAAFAVKVRDVLEKQSGYVASMPEAA